MTVTFRCPPELEPILPRPIPAVLGLPDWFKAMPQKASTRPWARRATVKKCPPFIDAMTYGFLIPLAIDLKVENGEFSWNCEVPGRRRQRLLAFADRFSRPQPGRRHAVLRRRPLHHQVQQFLDHRSAPGYSLLFTHPVNRTDLPFTTITGLVDTDTFHDSLVNFPARWHDAGFNGVLPKGTPVAQCLPVKRESWAGRFEALSGDAATRLIETRDAMARETDLYRRQFRAPKR